MEMSGRWAGGETVLTDAKVIWSGLIQRGPRERVGKKALETTNLQSVKITNVLWYNLHDK